MDKSLLKFAKDGDSSLLVWRVPREITSPDLDPDAQCYCLPIMSRPGGALYAVPDKVLSGEVLLDEMLAESSDSVLGPSREFICPLIIEDESSPGGVLELGITTTVQVLDLDDGVPASMRDYDPVTDSLESIFAFSETDTSAIPKLSAVLPQIVNWIEQIAHDKANFYSAREEPEAPGKATVAKKTGTKKAPKMTLAVLAEQMTSLQAQLQLISANQMAQAASSGGAGLAAERPPGPMIAKVPALSSGLLPGTGPLVSPQMVGPPPRTKPFVELNAPDAEKQVVPMAGTSRFPGGEAEVVNAISQQSLAITQLVAHLAGGDPLMDLASSSGSGGIGLSSKGVARRERMQADLASRSSSYFLQVQQQLYKRMNPSKPVPKTTEDLLAAGTSMTSYLERHGGYKQHRDVGLAMWVLAHAMDSAAADDFHATKEYLSLLTVALEQSVLDGGSWNIAYVLALLEDPPQNLFAERMQPLSASGRPFGPLVPPSWAAVTLSYLREIDVLTTRKSEVKKGPPAKTAAPSGSEQPGPPSPKRKPRFPKKPKMGEDSSPQG